MADSSLRVTRDGTVTVTRHIGTVTEVQIEDKLTRFFHDAAPRVEQKQGFGYRSRREAAEALDQATTPVDSSGDLG